MKSTDYNKAVAKGILAYWEAFPEKHNQGWWVNTDEVDKVEISPTALPDGSVKDVCNTSMCAAGTAVFLTSSAPKFKEFSKKYGYKDDFWVNKASNLLGLDSVEAYKLFYSENNTAKKLMQAVADGDKASFDKIVDLEWVHI